MTVDLADLKNRMYIMENSNQSEKVGLKRTKYQILHRLSCWCQFHLFTYLFTCLLLLRSQTLLVKEVKSLRYQLNTTSAERNLLKSQLDTLRHVLGAEGFS